ncbi:response regulator [Anaerobaca lacustris]|uniref:Response regulator n=1 Tax=Anaerobaca lacustris TaxID=3044600 RepID=A0AAW6U230_9BACT|nr:response regulator [Sedimentisphaerales bacterium M17dextr]
MMAERSQLGDVNVLASAANWAWPEAVRSLFRPRGINLMVAEDTSDFVHILGRTRVHTTIVDMDSERANALATIKIIRMDHPLLPCILLTSRVDQDVLGKALQLDVFGVIGKPVNMEVLHQLLNRLFLKKYNSDIFSQ